MKYLEAKGATPRGEHKMKSGIRADQIDIGRHGAKPAEPEPVKVRPEVQALADSLGVDIRSVTGTGANGSILVKDVRARKAEIDQPTTANPALTSIGISDPTERGDE